MPDGDVAARDVVEHPGAVAIVALDDAGRVLMIRQYRHPVGRLLWEIPAGLRDVAGEPLHAAARARTAARRPATGRARLARARRLFLLARDTDERLRVFLARGLAEVPTPSGTPCSEHEEAYLQLAWVPLERAVS